MNIITLEEEAFYELLNKAVNHVLKTHGPKAMDKWIDGEEAMRMLRITSKTTLYKLRIEGHIRYSQNEEMPKIILYDSESILAYLEKHAKNTF